LGEEVDLFNVQRIPKLDFSRTITRIDIDYDLYNKKFQAWDFVKKNNIMSDPVAVSLLVDPTLFAYAMLNMDMKPVKLYPYQDLIANDKYRYIIFNAANQIGKSLNLDIMAIYHFLREENVNIAIVSKSLPQSKFQISRIRSLLNNCRLHWKEETGESESSTLLTLEIKKYGQIVGMNRLICAPCTEGLLGYDLHYLYLDEFEFWEKDQKYFFEQTAQPRTYSTKGQIVIFSNPNGQQSYVAELEHQELLTGGKKWHHYNFNYLDKPGNTIAEYDQLKYELPRAQFESTVAAIRTLSDRCFFSPNEIEKSFDSQLENIKNVIVDKQTYWFLDVGAKHDQSCLIGCYKEIDMKDERFNHLYFFVIQLYPQGYPISRVAGVNVDESDGWHYVKSVREYLEEYKYGGVQPLFGFDVTGNQGMRALFEAIGIEAIDVTFSGPQKSQMYQRFKYFMEKGLLHRIKHAEWERQASELIVTKGQRGYLLINAASVALAGKSEDAKLKRIPDDTQDATVGCIYLADSPEAEPSAIFIPSGGQKP